MSKIFISLIVLLSFCNFTNDFSHNSNSQENDLLTKLDRVDDSCDFTIYNPIIVSHFIQTSLTSKELPLYPKEAAKRKIQGNISVKILVNKEGKVIRACALNGDNLLREASEQAALKWTFEERKAAKKNSYILAGITFKFLLSKFEAENENGNAVTPD